MSATQKSEPESAMHAHVADAMLLRAIAKEIDGCNAQHDIARALINLFNAHPKLYEAFNALRTHSGEELFYARLVRARERYARGNQK